MELYASGSACGVMVTVVRNGHGGPSSKSPTRLFEFHIALIHVGKV